MYSNVEGSHCQVKSVCRDNLFNFSLRYRKYIQWLLRFPDTSKLKKEMTKHDFWEKMFFILFSTSTWRVYIVGLNAAAALSLFIRSSKFRLMTIWSCLTLSNIIFIKEKKFEIFLFSWNFFYQKMGRERGGGHLSCKLR